MCFLFFSSPLRFCCLVLSDRLHPLSYSAITCSPKDDYVNFPPLYSWYSCVICLHHSLVYELTSSFLSLKFHFCCLSLSPCYTCLQHLEWTHHRCVFRLLIETVSKCWGVLRVTCKEERDVLLFGPEEIPVQLQRVTKFYASTVLWVYRSSGNIPFIGK